MYQTQIHYISNARFNNYCVCANCWTKPYFLLCSQWMNPFSLCNCFGQNIFIFDKYLSI